MLYSYVPQVNDVADDEELRVREGQSVVVLDSSDPDWFAVKILGPIVGGDGDSDSIGSVGLVPASYVQLQSSSREPVQSSPMATSLPLSPAAAATSAYVEHATQQQSAGIQVAQTLASHTGYVDPMQAYAQTSLETAKKEIPEGTRLWQVSETDRKKKKVLKKGFLALNDGTQPETLLFLNDLQIIYLRWPISDIVKWEEKQSSRKLKIDFVGSEVRDFVCEGPDAKKELSDLAAALEKIWTRVQQRGSSSVQIIGTAQEAVTASLAPPPSAMHQQQPEFVGLRNDAPPIIDPSPAAAAVEQKLATALFDYHPDPGHAAHDELQLTEGEKLMVIDSSDADWCRVKRILKRGSKPVDGKLEGVVPITYVELLKCESPVSPSRPSSFQTPTVSAPTVASPASQHSPSLPSRSSVAEKTPGLPDRNVVPQRTVAVPGLPERPVPGLPERETPSTPVVRQRPVATNKQSSPGNDSTLSNDYGQAH
jgi:hypothetical protein